MNTPIVTPSFPLTAHINVGPLLQAGFYLTLIIFMIFTAILLYHWQSYSSSKAVTAQTYLLYGVLSVPLLITMATVAFSHA